MIAAFLIGLLGSVHCVGMCGPLMLTLTRQGNTHSPAGFVLYHSGRLVTYSFIGVLFGTLSMSLHFFHFQQTGSIVFGLLIILIYAFPKFRNTAEGWYYQSWFYQTIKAKMTPLYRSKWKWLASGVLNGFLPCGLIYLAAAGAVLAGGFTNAILFMLAFGAGTLPALAGVALLSSHLPRLAKTFTRFTTPIALISGALLIFRGLTIAHPDLNELLKAQINQVISTCGF